MKQFDTEENKIQDIENYKPTYIGEQHNNNCQQFFGPIINGTFNMPVPNQQTKQKPKQQSRKVNKLNDVGSKDKPKTLAYFQYGNKSLLQKQQKRVDIIFRKFNEWKWLDDSTSADDFDSFFKGEPRFCNISWKGTNSILTILVQKLLDQDYITKQIGCSTRSLVEKQFRLTPNYDKDRLDQDAIDKINITVLILDINNPLPERLRRESNDEIDIQDAALMGIYGGQLRSTKGI